MTAKRTPMQTEEQRRARVLAHVDRARRVGAMLDRWEAENVADEPEWDVEDLERMVLRAPGP